MAVKTRSMRKRALQMSKRIMGYSKSKTVSKSKLRTYRKRVKSSACRKAKRCTKKMGCKKTRSGKRKSYCRKVKNTRVRK